jgi:hypothetical protein
MVLQLQVLIASFSSNFSNFIQKSSCKDQFQCQCQFEPFEGKKLEAFEEES